MDFAKDISVIFLTYIKQNVDFDLFVEAIIEGIPGQKSKWDLFDFIFDKYQSLFLKIIHTYSITIFETFNQDFFNEISKVHNLSNKNFKTTPSKILKFFHNNFKINLKNEFELWDGLKENICRRNVIIHNMGRIDKSYQDCINTTTDILDKMIGADIPHDINYVKNSIHSVIKYTIFTFKRVTQFYNLIGINAIVESLAEDPYFADVNPNLLNEDYYMFRYKVELLEGDQATNGNSKN